jgi:hypothetical protein
VAAVCLPVVAMTVLLGTGASAARASGKDVPDLALVVTNGSARTETLRARDEGFAELWDLFRPTESRSEPVSEAWQEGRFPRVRATVVWGLTGIGGWPYTRRTPGGDVAIERQDQVFLAEDGTPWIRSDPSPDVADDDVRWHRGTRAAYDRLERAGVFGVEASGDGRGERVRWGLWGAGAGVALGAGGVLAGRWRTGRRSGPPTVREPRQELIDL